MYTLSSTFPCAHLARAQGEKRAADSIVAAVLRIRRADQFFNHSTAALLKEVDGCKSARNGRELAVSVRSVYREIADLISQGLPIRSEAGIP